MPIAAFDIYLVQHATIEQCRVLWIQLRFEDRLVNQCLRLSFVVRPRATFQVHTSFDVKIHGFPIRLRWLPIDKHVLQK